MSDGEVYQINISQGGVPKRPIPVGAVTRSGLAGDRQAKPGIHGGPYRALSLFALEVIEALAAEGHPISPGSVGENVTTRGLDWSRVRPGTRLRLGSEVLVEITSYADPCTTVSGSFSDGNMNRINERRAPGRSRVYAQVLEIGNLRPRDPVAIESSGSDAQAGLASELAVRGISQVALPVADLGGAIEFYRDRLGAKFMARIDPPGLAHFDLAGVQLMLEGAEHSGDAKPSESTTVYFQVEDIGQSYEAMRAVGVEFDVPPLLQYKTDAVEGWMAFFRDPYGNRLALVSHVPVSTDS